MQPRVITIIVADDPAVDGATRLAEQRLTVWPTVQRPPVHALTLSQLQHDPELMEPGIAWLIFDSASDPDLYAALDFVEQRRIPAAVACGDEVESIGAAFSDGVVLCPPAADPAEVCVMLRVLLNQSAVVESMRREIRVLQVQQGGLADQIDKMDEELRLAAQLQREFLPMELPSVGGIRFEVLWRPAGYVSGDIYDVFRLDETHVGFFVADAVGHGVPAALMTMFIKRSLPTKRIVCDSDRGYELVSPGEALARLNHDMIERQTGKVRFATACYAVVDTQTLQLNRSRRWRKRPSCSSC